MSVLSIIIIHWIEEPTSPDDIPGHATIARAVAPIRVATGEHVHTTDAMQEPLPDREPGTWWKERRDLSRRLTRPDAGHGLRPAASMAAGRVRAPQARGYVW